LQQYRREADIRPDDEVRKVALPDISFGARTSRGWIKFGVMTRGQLL
jgi:hypothetical protein